MELCIKMYKNVKLCSYMYVSNNVQTQRRPQIYFH